jgi:glucan phosphoethanolaminetransferase (alkaline phosphatase superfamily)
MNNKNNHEVKGMAGRAKQTQIHPYIAGLLKEHGYETLWQAAQDKKVPYTTLIRYAESDGNNKYLEAAKRTADAFGLTLDEFVDGLLSPPKKKDKAS